MNPQAHKNRLIWIASAFSIVLFLIGSPALAQYYAPGSEGDASNPTHTVIEPAASTPTSTATPVGPPPLITMLTGTQTATATCTPTSCVTSTGVASATPTMEINPNSDLFYLFLPFIGQAEDTPTPTASLTPTITPSPTPTLTPSPPAPPETLLFCDNMSASIFIPDNNPTGISNQISIADPRQIVHLSVYVDISHTWVSDLTVILSNLSTGEDQTLIDRPGYPLTTYGCSNNNIISILDDRAEQPVEDQCYSYPAAISGAYRPNEDLHRFTGSAIAGTWRLRVVDSYVNDTGYLNGWCLEATIAEILPPPTPTPPPDDLPSSATVTGMSGEDQQLPLDCESRSAVDWAAHFNVQIDELDFYYNLPHSDDPDSGFVGDVMGVWGQIPPDDYGVHAIPIAVLLNEYGLPAYPRHALDWDTVRAEIAGGDPVITWIIGGSYHSLVNGIPRFYTAASNGHHSVVAAYEHTVIVTGYTETQVTVLNGGSFVTLSLDQFLDSWSALWNMAILASP